MGFHVAAFERKRFQRAFLGPLAKAAKELFGELGVGVPERVILYLKVLNVSIW
jgi:hypothetical protein